MAWINDWDSKGAMDEKVWEPLLQRQFPVGKSISLFRVSNKFSPLLLKYEQITEHIRQRRACNMKYRDNTHTNRKKTTPPPPTRDRTHSSCISCNGRRILYHEPPRKRFLHVHEKGSNYLRKNSYSINSYSILGYSYPNTNLGLWFLFKSSIQFHRSKDNSKQ